jgi:glycosyltransferase involved in cell wall biosynthesis
VCIPTCDGELFLAEAIESVLAQTFEAFELLIVDDCSSDRTLEIVSRYADPRLRVYQNHERLGIAGNWNRCLELARGGYFSLFHQDDVMLPANLEQKVRLLEAEPSVGFVHSSVDFLVEPAAPHGSRQWMEDSTDDFVVDGRRYFRTMVISGNRVCAPTVVARREALADVGGFNEHLKFALDYELWLRVCVNWRVAFLSRPLVRYRWHQMNTSHGFRFERALDETFAAASSALTFYGACGGNEEERALLVEVLATVDRQRRWAAELEKARIWLFEQHANWKDLAEQREIAILELGSQIEELSKTKHWLSEQNANWKTLAGQRESMVLELRGWIDELERARTWLAEQSTNWKDVADQREAKIVELQGWISELEKAKR